MTYKGLVRIIIAFLIMTVLSIPVFAADDCPKPSKCPAVKDEDLSKCLYGGEDSEFQKYLDCLMKRDIPEGGNMGQRTQGNGVLIFPEPKEDYIERLRIMDNAKDHIYIYTLLLRVSGTTGLQTAAKLMAKKTLDDVDSGFIYHPVSQMFYSSPSVIIAMNALGVQCRGYWPRINYNILNLYKYLLVGCHKKLMTADDPTYGLVSIVGGRNIGDEYLTDIPDSNKTPGMDWREEAQWRDTDIVVYGPFNYDTDEDFVRSFNEQSTKGKPKFEKVDRNKVKVSVPTDLKSNICGDIVPNVEMRLIENEPGRANKSGGEGILQINPYYNALVDRAQKYIDIESPYFVPTDDMFLPLVNAAKRGVKVRLLTNSKNTNDMGAFLVNASGWFWKPLIEAGAEVYLWDMPRVKVNGVIDPTLFRTMHSKIMIVDKSVFIQSSFNYDGRGVYGENEWAFPADSTELAAKAQKLIDGDFQAPHLIKVTKEVYNSMFTEQDRIMMYFLSRLNNFL